MIYHSLDWWIMLSIKNKCKIAFKISDRISGIFCDDPIFAEIILSTIFYKKLLNRKKWLTQVKYITHFPNFW